MTRETYLQQRAELLDAAQKLIDSDDLSGFEAKTKEVDALDALYEKSAAATANLAALAEKRVGGSFSAAAANPVNPVAFASMGSAEDPADIYDSAEYKRAFQLSVCRGVSMPGKFRNDSDEVTKTTDSGDVIPTSTMQKIYEAMANIGMILPLVTKTSFKGGLNVPTSSARPTATWVAESGSTYSQKKAVTAISFGYHKLRCEIAMSYEMANLAYPMFEATFVRNVSEAMVKAEEKAIISGTGSTYYQPAGILTETPAATVEITEGQHISYANICAAEGEEVRDDAVWVMTKKTYMGEIEGMVDENGQPVARVNYGLGTKPEYFIKGRRVVIVNPDYMATFATSVTADTICAFMYSFSDYIFNTASGMTTRRFTDNDTDDEHIKAIALVDGKSVLNESLVVLKIKNS